MKSQGILLLEVIATFHSAGTVTFVQKNNKKIICIDELYHNQVASGAQRLPSGE